MPPSSFRCPSPKRMNILAGTCYSDNTGAPGLIRLRTDIIIHTNMRRSLEDEGKREARYAFHGGPILN